MGKGPRKNRELRFLTQVFKEEDDSNSAVCVRVAHFLAENKNPTLVQQRHFYTSVAAFSSSTIDMEMLVLVHSHFFLPMSSKSFF